MKKLTRIFSIIGMVSSILFVLVAATIIWLYFQASNNKGSNTNPKCIDGYTVVIDTQSLNGFTYQLIYNQSGFADKVHFIHLFKSSRASSSSCIEKEHVVFSEVIEYGPERGSIEQRPVSIAVRNDKLFITYNKGPEADVPLFNVPITWGE